MNERRALTMPRAGWRRLAWAGVCLLLVVLVAAVNMAPPATSGASPNALRWGVYQIYWGGGRFAGALDESLQPLASRPDYVMFYRDIGRGYPRSGIDVIRKVGATPIISFELWNWHKPKVKHLPKIVAGDYDDYFRKWASDAKTDGQPVFLRFGFEFNGDWFSWGGEPELFVKAWRRARGIFREVGADNVKWVWCPNITSHPSGDGNSMHRYWPGVELVDWVGVDGYNWGDGYREWHRWTSFEKLYEGVLADLTRRYPGKPIMVAETGCPEDDDDPTRKATWIREAHAYLSRRSAVRAVVWFNYDKRREGELNFRVDSSVGAMAAFNKTFAAP